MRLIRMLLFSLLVVGGFSTNASAGIIVTEGRIATPSDTEDDEKDPAVDDCDTEDPATDCADSDPEDDTALADLDNDPDGWACVLLGLGLQFCDEDGELKEGISLSGDGCSGGALSASELWPVALALLCLVGLSRRREQEGSSV